MISSPLSLFCPPFLIKTPFTLFLRGVKFDKNEMRIRMEMKMEMKMKMPEMNKSDPIRR